MTSLQRVNKRHGVNVLVLPRPLRRAVNLLRRIPYLSILFGERPVEPAANRFYPEYITKSDVVVEVGARMGDGTRVLAEIARHVYAFEPARQNYLILKALTRHLHNVEAYNLALADQVGEAYLNKDRSFSGVASLRNIAEVNYVAQERVRVFNLDALKFKISPTSLVLDCEGAECEVLRGGVNLLPTLRSVLVETHVLSDGSNTTEPVVEELNRFFPNVRVESVAPVVWVLARK